MMKLASLLLLLQVLLLSVAPALAILPEAVCCVEACEDETSQQPVEHNAEGEGEQCNPFSCTSCCLSILPKYQPNTHSVHIVEEAGLFWAAKTIPPLQPQHGIWHPPRRS